jgi:proteasome lid subunit RPN8/RPN11
MRLVILLLALHASASATDSYDIRRATDDPQVLAIMQDIALRGAHQFDQQEVAAFLVRDANGVIASVMWPHTANRRSEHYDGVVPAGTVAIAHTHPTFAERPSHGDIEQAKKIGLPIYVITRWNLYVVDATGAVIPLIVQENWARSPKTAEGRIVDGPPRE